MYKGEKFYPDDVLGSKFNENVTTILNKFNCFFHNVKIKKICLPKSTFTIDVANKSSLGTAINIMIDYELYRKDFVSYFEPRIYPKVKEGGVHYKILSTILDKIDNKVELSSTDIYILTIHNNLVRMGIQIYSYGPEIIKKLSNKEYDIEIIDYLDNNKTRILNFFFKHITKGNIIENPTFGNIDLGINADGDFIYNKCLYEIKCQNIDEIRPKTIKQLFMYKLLNDYNKQNFKLLYNEIDSLAFINPVKEQIYKIDLELPKELISNFKKYSEEGIFQVHKMPTLEYFVTNYTKFKYIDKNTIYCEYCNNTSFIKKGDFINNPICKKCIKKG